MLEPFTQQLAEGSSLNSEAIAQVVESLVLESVPAEEKADFLCAMALKGETVREIAGFARALRKKAVPVPLDESWRSSHYILDVCGTGGDRLDTFNISTTVSIVCAAAGVPVAKHGNRAVTSKCGSADVLETLGIRTDLSPSEAAESLRVHHFAFFFAPLYHPAFRHLAAARRICAERGKRTIFNFLGPLLNPALPTAQLVGVPRPELCLPIAEVLQSLGGQRGMVVCGMVPLGSGTSAYLDELSTLGDSTIAEFYQEKALTQSVYPAHHPVLQPATLEDLAGGDSAANAEIIRRVLEGTDRGPRRDAVLWNAAAALFVGGRVKSLEAGWDLAGQTIDESHASQKLRDLASGSV